MIFQAHYSNIKLVLKAIMYSLFDPGPPNSSTIFFNAVRTRNIDAFSSTFQ